MTAHLTRLSLLATTLFVLAACGGSSSGGGSTDTGSDPVDGGPSFDVAGDGVGQDVPTVACEVDADCTDKLVALGVCEVAVCNTTTGTCEAATADDGTGCDDGNPCTEADQCTAGSCAGSEVTCADPDLCNGTETCNPATGECEAGTPVACDDGDPCNGVETCNSDTGSCDPGTALVCDDGDPCNGVESCNSDTGACDPGTALVCDDGDPCNGVESCEPDTGCVTGTPVVCTDWDVCNGVETCDSSTGNCVDGEPLVCDDDDVCNGAEWCDPDLGCQAGTALVCADDNDCTDDSCDATEGCQYVDNSDPCDDGNDCTDGDHCDGGLCVYDSVVCAEDCADGEDNDLDGDTDCADGDCAMQRVCNPRLRFLAEPGADSLAGAPFDPALEVEVLRADGTRNTDVAHDVTLLMTVSGGGNVLHSYGCATGAPAADCLVHFDVVDADTPERVTTWDNTLEHRQIVAMAFNPSDRRLYARDHLTGDLLNMDPTTGAFWVQAAGALENSGRGMAFVDGAMITTGHWTDEIYSVDPATGAETLLGNLVLTDVAGEVGGVMGLATDHETGTLYGLVYVDDGSSDTLVIVAQINLETMGVARVADVATGTLRHAGLVRTPDGRFLLLGGNDHESPGSLSVLDPDTGEISRLLTVSRETGGEQIVWIPAYLGGTRTVTSVDGVATFPDVWATAAGEDFVVSTAASGHYPDDTAPFAVRDDSDRYLVFTEPPDDALVGRTMERVTVEMRDSLDRPVVRNGVPITVSLGAAAANVLHAHGCAGSPPDVGCTSLVELVDADTPQRVETIASALEDVKITALAYNAIDGLVYGREDIGADLVTLDPATGELTVRVSGMLVNTARAFAFRDGVLYAGGAANATLYTVDLDTGVETSQGGLSVVGGGVLFGMRGFEYEAATGQFWALAQIGMQVQLATVDVDALTLTPVAGVQEAGVNFTGLTVLPDGRLVAIAGEGSDEPGTLYTLDRTTGEATRLLGPAPSASGGEQITAVPAPLLGSRTLTTNWLGAARFEDLQVPAAGTGFTLEAAAPGWNAATSPAFDVQDDSDRYLDFFTQPSDSLYPNAFDPYVRVILYNSWGEAIGVRGAEVTLRLENNPGVRLLQAYGCGTGTPETCSALLQLVEPLLGERDGVLANPLPNRQITSMAYNAADGFLYARDHRAAALLRVDPTTGASEEVATGSLSTVTRATAIFDGVLFALTRDTSALYTIDLTTGAEGAAQTLSVTDGRSLAFVYGGCPGPGAMTMYALVDLEADDGSFETLLGYVDLNSLELTPMGVYGGNEPSLAGLAMLPNGTLIAVGGANADHPGALYTLDPVTGDLSLFVEAAHTSTGAEQIVVTPALLTGTATREVTGSIATFYSLRVKAIGAAYTLRAMAEGFAEAISDPFNVSAP